MKRLSILLMILAAPAPAQDLEEGPGPLSRGIENFFGDLFSDVEPHLRQLRDAIGQLDDYEAPEMLPNGDIIMRRKTPLDDAPELDEPEPEREEQEAEPGAPVDI